MARLTTAAFAVCLFLLIVGAKWATFDRFGSPMPDWDQWDAEAIELIVPWFTNDNFLTHLIHPHNEHRVVLTKLQNLALVLLNGQWDSRLEAVTNAMLHAALAVAFWLTVRRWAAARWEAPLFLLVLALCGLPLAWQNILGGFHSQQYWLIALSFAAIAVLPFARPWSVAWWLGSLAALLALGSMGSGLLAAATVLALTGWRVLRKDLTWRAALPTALVSAAVLTLGLWAHVEVDWHQDLKAKTLHDFVFSIVHSLEWPLRHHHWAAPILWLPWVIVTVRLLRGCTPPGARAPLTLAALGGWVLVQIVATAYARGVGADYPASRYMDTLSFGAMVNAAALAWWTTHDVRGGRHRFARIIAIAAWMITLALGLHEVTERNLRYEMPDAKKYYVKAEGHMRRYLATNDPKELAYPDIPFPSAEGLVERLAMPTIRPLMPVPIRAPVGIAGAANNDASFAPNDARRGDPEAPPQHGLSPGTPPLDFAVSWGSFGGNGLKSHGTWRSAPVTPGPFGWLKFEVAGDPGPPHNHDVTLALHDAATDEELEQVIPSRRPMETWRSVYVRAPDRPFVIVARDNSAGGWIAFSPPVEMSGGSYLARQATRHGMLLVYLTAAATLGLALCQIVVRRRETRPVAPKFENSGDVD